MGNTTVTADVSKLKYFTRAFVVFVMAIMGYSMWLEYNREQTDDNSMRVTRELYTVTLTMCIVSAAVLTLYLSSCDGQGSSKSCSANYWLFIIACGVGALTSTISLFSIDYESYQQEFVWKDLLKDARSIGIFLLLCATGFYGFK